MTSCEKKLSIMLCYYRDIEDVQFDDESCNQITQTSHIASNNGDYYLPDLTIKPYLGEHVSASRSDCGC